MSMSSIRKLMHTSALNFSQASRSRFTILTGMHYTNDNIAYNSNSTQTDKPKNISPRKDRFISESDQFITEMEDDESTLNEPDKPMPKNITPMKDKFISETDQFITEMEDGERILNEPDPENYEPVLMLSEEEVNKSGLKKLSKDDEDFDTKGRMEDLMHFEDNQKHESFVARDDVKKAMLDVYGKANEHMLDQIMCTSNNQLEEISLHQLETQVVKLLQKDQIFQEEFPKKAFFEYDKNLDGKLHPKEIKLALTKIGENVDKGKLNTIMKNYDKDGDGYLSYQEFCDFSQKELFPK